MTPRLWTRDRTRCSGAERRWATRHSSWRRRPSRRADSVGGFVS